MQRGGVLHTVTRAKADSPCCSPGMTVKGWSEQAPGRGDMRAARPPPLNSCIEPMRTPGVEPGSQAWEACMMPLHYVRWCLCRNKHLNRLARHLYIFKFSITSWSPGCSCSVTESSDSDTPCRILIQVLEASLRQACTLGWCAVGLDGVLGLGRAPAGVCVRPGQRLGAGAPAGRSQPPTGQRV